MRSVGLAGYRIAKWSASIFVVVASSCTEYTPVRTAASSLGYDVRVNLSDAGAVDLVPKIGAGARQIEGTVKQTLDTSLVVSVRRVVREGGGEDTYADLDLLLPSRDVESLELSRTSVSRSILAAGAVIATALLAAKGAGDLSGSKTGGPPPSGR